MSEKGQESMQDRYYRIKMQGLQSFEDEMKKKYIDDEHRKLFHHYCNKSYGCVPTQELMMMMLMDAKFANFTLGEANNARKIVAKKKMDKIPALREQVFSRFEDADLALYFWDIAIKPSLGYAFSVNHSLPYSFVGIQTIELATKFNPLYWDTACLIVNSGSLNNDILEPEEIVDIYEEEGDKDYTYKDLPDRSGKIKEKKNATTDYTKMAKAIGAIKEKNIDVSLIDINKSLAVFKPDIDNNKILYGLQAVNGIGTDVVETIIKNRPYTDFYDFLNKTKLTKKPMVSLIKAGSFDAFGDRRLIMATYIWLTCDKKKELNLRNFGTLIKRDYVPKSMNKVSSVYEVTRYLKAKCKMNDSYFKLDERTSNFMHDNDYYNNYVELSDGNEVISQKLWEDVYQDNMDIAREWIKDNKDELLKKLNIDVFKEDWEKYAEGNISKWEMQSVCFYYHDHELINLDNDKYGIVNFFDLSEQPEPVHFIPRGGAMIPIYKIETIAGTCIAKDKIKSTITLLTVDGVVTVKFRKEYFTVFDKRISQKQADGKKKIIENSWFERGTMLMIKGIRRGDDFIPKKYSNMKCHELYKINNINKYGEIEIISERASEN